MDIDDFDKRRFVPEAVRGYRDRKLYGIVALTLETCAECGGIMIAQVPHWQMYQLWAKGLSLDTQVRRAGWRYRQPDTPYCKPCYERVKGFPCAICGMLRRPDQIAESFGNYGHPVHACTSCKETMPALLWRVKVDELRARHTRNAADDDDSTDEDQDA